MLKVVLAQRRGREGTEQPTVVTQFADRTGLIEWRTDTFEKFPDDQFKARYTVLATLFPVDAEVAVMQLLEQLRENEGASVTITCPNPDFNGQPDQVIEVSDDWTGWVARRFGGATLLDACKAAMLAKTTPPPIVDDNPFRLYRDYADRVVVEAQIGNLVADFMTDLYELQCRHNAAGASDTVSREAVGLYIAKKLG